MIITNEFVDYYVCWKFYTIYDGLGRSFAVDKCLYTFLECMNTFDRQKELYINYGGTWPNETHTVYNAYIGRTDKYLCERLFSLHKGFKSVMRPTCGHFVEDIFMGIGKILDKNFNIVDDKATLRLVENALIYNKKPRHNADGVNNYLNQCGVCIGEFALTPRGYPNILLGQSVFCIDKNGNTDIGYITSFTNVKRDGMKIATMKPSYSPKGGLIILSEAYDVRDYDGPRLDLFV